MTPVGYSIWALGFALDASALMMLRRRSLRLSSLNAYLAFAIARAVCMAAILVFSPGSYSSAYWLLRPWGFLVDIALAVEICWRVSEAANRRLIAGAGFMTMLLFAVCFHGFDWGHYDLGVVILSRVSAALRISLFFMALLLAKRWPWPLRGIAAGFGLMAAVGLAISSVGYFLGPQASAAARQLLPISEIAGLLAWVYSLATVQPQPIKADISPIIQPGKPTLRESIS